VTTMVLNKRLCLAEQPYDMWSSVLAFILRKQVSEAIESGATISVKSQQRQSMIAMNEQLLLIQYLKGVLKTRQ